MGLILTNWAISATGQRASHGEESFLLSSILERHYGTQWSTSFDPSPGKEIVILPLRNFSSVSFVAFRKSLYRSCWILLINRNMSKKRVITKSPAMEWSGVARQIAHVRDIFGIRTVRDRLGRDRFVSCPLLQVGPL
jgi:hypothetical protein